MLEIPTNEKDNSLPQLEFNIRTGVPTKQKIVNISDIKTQKGLWLKNKLKSLYDDSKFKNASPEQQKEWKSLAYDKWVNPYFTKVLKINAPSKEDWLAGSTHFLEGTEAKDTALTKLDKELKGHTLKATADVTSGLLHDLSYVGKALDYLTEDTDRKSGEKTLQQHIQSASDFFAKRSKEIEQEDLPHPSEGKLPFSKDIPGRLAELGTGAAFFEATGAAKAAKALNIVNPKTADLTFQMVKSSWNAAVDFGTWSASQGESPKDIIESASTGAVFGIGAKLFQRKGFDPLFQMFKTLFKWGGKEATEEVLKEAFEKNLKGIKEDSKLSIESQKASDTTSKLLENYSLEKFKRSYKDLPYIQRVHVMNRVMTTVVDAVQTAKTEGMPKQIIQAQAQETDQLMREIFPEAKVSQERVEQFIKANGEPPQQTKLLASLPHHNTTIESPWKHLQARASFLKSRLRTAKGQEKEVIRQALNEEYSLMKEKKIKESSSKGTVGGAAAGDPKVFKGDEFVITPNIDPFKHNFTEWYEDSFAKNVARSAKEQALAKGQKQSFLANAIDNSFLIGSNLAREVRMGFGETKQLLHSQFGVVGGINYDFRKATSLGERSGLNPSEDILYINFLGMRPNVVSRVWNVPGGGQTLFLNAALEADRRNIGIALIPLDESKSFYEKMGMKEIGSYMVMNKDQVKDLLKNKGLLMMLLGAGITYGAGKDLNAAEVSVNSKNNNQDKENNPPIIKGIPITNLETAYAVFKGRSLTQEELSQIAPVFKDLLDLNKIKVHDIPKPVLEYLEGKRVTGLHRRDIKNEIAITTEKGWPPSESITGHEITHIYQTYNGKYNDNPKQSYNFGDLKKARKNGKKFEDFGTEQQATIVEKFVTYSDILKNKQYEDNEEKQFFITKIKELQPFIDDLRNSKSYKEIMSKEPSKIFNLEEAVIDIKMFLNSIRSGDFKSIGIF